MTLVSSCPPSMTSYDSFPIFSNKSPRRVTWLMTLHCSTTQHTWPTRTSSSSPTTWRTTSLTPASRPPSTGFQLWLLSFCPATLAFRTMTGLPLSRNMS
eukprot:4032591-Pleurochrysis_carterae.AAC.1